MAAADDQLDDGNKECNLTVLGVLFYNNDGGIANKHVEQHSIALTVEDNDSAGKPCETC